MFSVHDNKYQDNKNYIKKQVDFYKLEHKNYIKKQVHYFIIIVTGKTQINNTQLSKEKERKKKKANKIKVLDR